MSVAAGSEASAMGDSLPSDLSSANLQTPQIESAAASGSLGAVLAQQGLTLEQVLPSDPGGWVRILSAIDNEDR